MGGFGWILWIPSSRSMSPSDALGKWRAWENHLFFLRERPQLDPAGTVNEHVTLPAASPPEKPWPAATTSDIQALLTMHYVAERGFLQDVDLLDAAAGFDFPLRLIHGQCDCVCPVQSAKDLASAVGSNAELLLTTAGHSQWDKENIHEFVGATDEIYEMEFRSLVTTWFSYPYHLFSPLQLCPLMWGAWSHEAPSR